MPLFFHRPCSSANAGSVSLGRATPRTSTPKAGVMGRVCIAITAAMLLAFDVGALHHAAPFVDLALDDLAKLFGRGADADRALLEQLRLDVGPHRDGGDRLLHSGHR